jgi:hypothetical protein
MLVAVGNNAFIGIRWSVVGHFSLMERKMGKQSVAAATGQREQRVVVQCRRAEIIKHLPTLAIPVLLRRAHQQEAHTLITHFKTTPFRHTRINHRQQHHTFKNTITKHTNATQTNTQTGG